MPALTPGDTGDRRRHGFIDVHRRLQPPRRPRCLTQEVVHQLALERLGSQHHLVRVWWEAKLLSLCQCAMREFRIALTANRVVQRMLRKVCLYQHLSTDVTATCPACDLREQREQLFRRTKIATVERTVRIYDAHQSQARKVVAFG